jgi:hypothetical protein
MMQFFVPLWPLEDEKVYSYLFFTIKGRYTV